MHFSFLSEPIGNIETFGGNPVKWQKTFGGNRHFRLKKFGGNLNISYFCTENKEVMAEDTLSRWICNHKWLKDSLGYIIL